MSIDIETEQSSHKKNYGKWQAREAVVLSAQAFTSANSWRKAHPGAYASARSNGWMEEATCHFARRKTWTDDDITHDAKRFETRRDWRAASPTAYSLAKQRKIVDLCCLHMQRIRKPNRYWTKERCLASARLHFTLADWTQADPGAVDAATRNGFYREAVQHMVRVPSVGELCIARYLTARKIPFERQKQFPGLAAKRSLRFDFYLPSFRILIEYQGRHHRVEGAFGKSAADLAKIQDYDRRKRTYAGSHDLQLIEIESEIPREIELQLDGILLGTDPAFRPAPHRIPDSELQQRFAQSPPDRFVRWTYQAVAKEASLYDCYGAWTGTRSYQVAVRRGWAASVSAHMTRADGSRRRWTLEELARDAQRFSSRKAWQKGSGSAYQSAWRRGVIDVVAPHLQPKKKSLTRET